MVADDSVNDAQAVLKRIELDRGARRRWHETLARYDAAALERYHENFRAVMALPALGRKEKHLLIMAIDAYKAWPGIKVHIREALRAGATEDEMVEAIVTAAIPGGASVLAFGMEMLDEVLAERGADEGEGDRDDKHGSRPPAPTD